MAISIGFLLDMGQNAWNEVPIEIVKFLIAAEGSSLPGQGFANPFLDLVPKIRCSALFVRWCDSLFSWI